MVKDVTAGENGLGLVEMIGHGNAGTPLRQRRHEGPADLSGAPAACTTAPEDPSDSAPADQHGAIAEKLVMVAMSSADKRPRTRFRSPRSIRDAKESQVSVLSNVVASVTCSSGIRNTSAKSFRKRSQLFTKSTSDEVSCYRPVPVSSIDRDYCLAFPRSRSGPLEARQPCAKGGQLARAAEIDDVFATQSASRAAPPKPDHEMASKLHAPRDRRPGASC
jgi:hypothetical protein